MKIGVLSDTHIHSLKAGQRLADFLLKGPFRDIEMVLHAGDHVIPDLDSCFDGLPYFGVCGNMDRCSPHLPQRRIVSIGPYRVGMVHGWGAPDGIEDRVLHCFRGDKTDVIIFGHSHQPLCRLAGSILLLNPGSATDRRSAPFHSAALLHLDDKISAEIVRID